MSPTVRGKTSKNFITQEAHARHGAVRSMYSYQSGRGNDPTGHPLIAVLLSTFHGFWQQQRDSRRISTDRLPQK